MRNLLTIIAWLLLAASAFAQPALPTQAICRVSCGPGVVGAGVMDCGSGTLIDTNGDREGIVATNNHVVAGGGPYKVTFADGKSHMAVLVMRNPQLDIAILKIGQVDRAPARWTSRIEGKRFFSAGFGGNGKLVFKHGAREGGSVRGAQVNVNFSMPINSGDSGGPVFDEQGRLCAVCWGGEGESAVCNYDDTVAVSGACLAKYLATIGVKPTPVEQQYSYGGCPGGRCQPHYQPQQPDDGGGIYVPGEQPEAPPAKPPIADKGCDCADGWEAIEKRVLALEQAKPLPGPQGPQGEPGLPGADGPQGVPGPAGKDATIDLDKLAEAVAGKLGERKIRVIQRDYYTGEVLDEGQVSLDGSGVLVLRYGVKGESKDARPQ